MATQQFALDPNGPKRLALTWKGVYKQMQVVLDGTPIGTIADQKQLREGREFMLPDGSLLRVQLRRSGMANELQVTRNGQPLPGSASDPLQRLKLAYGIIYFAGGLNIVLGLAAVLLDWRFLQNLGIGWPTVIFGGILVGLGLVVQQQRSLVALIAAMVLYAVDGVLGMVLAIEDGSPNTGPIIVRVILLISMYQGVKAIQELKRQSSTPGAPYGY